MTLPQIPESSTTTQSTNQAIPPDKRHAIISEPTERRGINAEPVVPVTVVASS